MCPYMLWKIKSREVRRSRFRIPLYHYIGLVTHRYVLVLLNFVAAQKGGPPSDVQVGEEGISSDEHNSPINHRPCMQTTQHFHSQSSQ